MVTELLLLIGFIVVLAIIMMMFAVSRYIQCPVGKVLVVHGKVESDTGYDVYSGGAAFVFPVIQSYSFIDLEIHRFDFRDKIYTKDNFGLKPNIGISFSVSTQPEVMKVSVPILLGCSKSEIAALGEDVIREDIRRYFKSKDVVDVTMESFNGRLHNELIKALEKNLLRVGLNIVNIDISDVKGLEEQISILENSYNGSSIVDSNAKERLSIIEKSIELNAEERRRLLSEKLSLLVKIK